MFFFLKFNFEPRKNNFLWIDFLQIWYKPCTQHATSWYNIPNKARFNPTEQMIVAYLNKQVIYAY